MNPSRRRTTSIKSRKPVNWEKMIARKVGSSDASRRRFCVSASNLVELMKELVRRVMSGGDEEGPVSSSMGLLGFFRTTTSISDRSWMAS